MYFVECCSKPSITLTVVCLYNKRTSMCIGSLSGVFITLCVIMVAVLNYTGGTPEIQLKNNGFKPML